MYLLHSMTDLNLSTVTWSINLAMPTPHVTALLRKSSAMDFLIKGREKRASECFPGGCSTEVSEAEESLEGYVCFLSILFCICSPLGYS